MKQQPIVIERVYNAPIHLVWRSLTDKDEMRKWYFDLSDFNLEVGFKFQFLAGEKMRKNNICTFVRLPKYAPEKNWPTVGVMTGTPAIP